MARLDHISKMIFNDNGVLRDKDESVDSYKQLWLLYHFYIAAVSMAPDPAGDPQDIFKTERAN